MYPLQYQATHDIDWFATINECPVHLASNGGHLPVDSYTVSELVAIQHKVANMQSVFRYEIDEEYLQNYLDEGEFYPDIDEMSDEDEFMKFDDEMLSESGVELEVNNNVLLSDQELQTDEIGTVQSSDNAFLSDHQIKIVTLLLSGGNVKEYTASNHLMLAVEIDAINEALYDEIGDTVIEFDVDTPLLVEDYIEDIKEILGIR